MLTSSNEKGSSLILVLLVSLIFMTLGLTIVAATIGGAKRTEIRGEEVDTTYKASRVMDEVIAEFHRKINQPTFKLDEAMLLNNQYSMQLNDFTDQLEENYSKQQEHQTLEILDLTLDYDIIPTKHFTRVYEVVVTAGNEDDRIKTAKRKVFLSPTPSFLQYVAGSSPDGTVNLNGGSKFIGNMFGNQFNISDKAFFMDEVSQGNGTEQNHALSVYPAIQGELFVRGQVNENDRLSDPSLTNYFFQSESTSEHGVPIIKRATNDYIDVNFKKTFAQKVNQMAGYSGPSTSEEDYSDYNGVNAVIKSLLSSCTNSILVANNPSCRSPIYLIEKDSNYLDINNNLPTNTTIVYADIKVDETRTNFEVRSPKHEDNAPLYVTNNVDLGQSWLVVHGDLIIDSSSKLTPIEISGNILVTGDLIIRGDSLSHSGNDEAIEDDEVRFDSTIYTLGKAEVYNTNISGLNNKQLILLTQGEMIITRINEFKDYHNVSPLEAYFYTDSSATLYGVGSLFYIKGGLFAKDELTISAIRQNIIQKSYNLSPNIISPNAQMVQNSRFTVEYDNSVIIDHLDALPRVDKLQLILDDLTIQ